MLTNLTRSTNIYSSSSSTSPDGVANSTTLYLYSFSFQLWGSDLSLLGLHFVGDVHFVDGPVFCLRGPSDFSPVLAG